MRKILFSFLSVWPWVGYTTWYVCSSVAETVMDLPRPLELPVQRSAKNLNQSEGVIRRGINCKRPIPICRLFFKIDLLPDIAALCLTDFIDWRYIHSVVCIFDPACELLPLMDEGTILVYCCPSTLHSL